MKNKYINISENIIYYSVILLPIALITGPFLSDSLVIISSILFLILIYNEKKFSIFKNNIFLFIFFFWVYIVISSLLSDYKLHSLKSSFFYIRFIIFALAVCYILKRKKIKNIFLILILIFTILPLDAILQYSIGKNIFFMPLIDPHRASSFFGDELILGSYLSRLTPLYFGLFLFFFVRKKIFLITSLILVELAIFFSGERASFVYSIIFISFFFILFNKFRLSRIISIVITALLILTYSSIEIKPIDRMFKKTFNQLTEHNQIYVFGNFYETMFDSSWRMFKHNPIIGIGPNNFRKYCNKKEFEPRLHNFQCSTHTHNFYIQAVSEIGIIGLLFLIFAKFKVITKIYHSFKNRKIIRGQIYVRTSCLICFIITLFPLVPNGNFFNNYLNILIYYPLGFYLYFSNSKSITKNKF